MQRDQYKRMAELQDHHWWFRAKRLVVGALVKKHMALTGNQPATTDWVLDAGCGTGAMISVMNEWGRVVGTDVQREGLQYINHRPLIEADILQLPFIDESFQLLGCFDVLYHRRIADVEATLLELHRVCRKDGLLVLTDSALPLLRSSHDAALHGARRFRLNSLQTLLENTGFHVIYGSYFHTLLFPIAAIVRLIKRIIEGTPDQDGSGNNKTVVPRSDLRPVPQWLNHALGAIYKIESALLKNTRLPIGLSVVIIAKPANTL